MNVLENLHEKEFIIIKNDVNEKVEHITVSKFSLMKDFSDLDYDFGD